MDGKRSKTTIRASVSNAEHAVLRRCAKRAGMTMSDFVREAVWAHVKKTKGVAVEQLAEIAAETAYYQPDLF